MESQVVVNMLKLSTNENVLKLKSLVNVQNLNHIECHKIFNVESSKVATDEE